MKRAIVSKPRGKRIDTVTPAGQGAIRLCSCCRSLPSCTFAKGHGQTILQCEEFDGATISRPRAISRRRMVVPAPTPVPYDAHLGLCGLCEDRVTCTFPKPEGGVWHCEEYR